MEVEWLAEGKKTSKGVLLGFVPGLILPRYRDVKHNTLCWLLKFIIDYRCIGLY